MAKNLNALEEQIELTRARLAANIDELAFRAHPANVAKRQAEGVKGFFISVDGSPRTDNILKVVGGVAGVVVVLTLVRKVVR